MDSSEITKIRRFALVIAVLLITLVVAGVELDSPVKMSPLGIPIVIRRPDLLTIALVIAAIYSTLRYVYYGMFLHRSPARIRRDLMAGRVTGHVPYGHHDLYFQLANKQIGDAFPSWGNSKVTFTLSQSSEGGKVERFAFPLSVRLLCWLEDFDYSLPVLANAIAVSLWFAKHVH